MSNNLHEQSKTCTDIVNDLAAWAETLEGAQNVVDAHLVACHMRVRVAQLKRQPALAARAPHPGAVAAVLTLQREGCVWDGGAGVWQQRADGQDWGPLASEECRNAALEVLRLALVDGHPGRWQPAIERLRLAVQREQ